MLKDKYILIETQYLPPVLFFAFLIKKSNLTLEACEHYQKGSYRNRCHILGANGLLRLSIPLKGGRNHGRLIKEVKISNEENWQRKHLQSIRSAYGTAPYFEHYFEGISDILSKENTSLYNLNLSLIKQIIKLLGLEISVNESSEYISCPEECLDLRNRLSPQKKNTEITFPSYFQMFSEKISFEPNLSILDTLFNLGPETRIYLTQLNKLLLNEKT